MKCTKKSVHLKFASKGENYMNPLLLEQLMLRAPGDLRKRSKGTRVLANSEDFAACRDHNYRPFKRPTFLYATAVTRL